MWLNQRDRESALRALFAIALLIYHHARETEPGQKPLPLDGGSFGLRVWKTAARQKQLDTDGFGEGSQA